MCGFAGFLAPTGGNPETCRQTLINMTTALHHRGPDESGYWLEDHGRLALGHRRLSIQDLSPAGSQPMTSASGRYVIAFNGEVYNFQELRRELTDLGFGFRGHSDTEVMLAAFEAWGVDASLKRFAGMFAFAVYDRQEQTVCLARDRMGEKPLYYGWQGNVLVFGSELKALREHEAWTGAVNPEALPLLLRHNFIPAPHTIYQRIYKLQPASLITFSLNCTTVDEEPKPQRYWHLEHRFAEEVPITFDEASLQLEQLLEQIVGEQMVSDVPLGAFLSGGIDSSTVVALMQRQASKPVRTFTIGFDEDGFNEAEHAAAVAKHLRTDHTELYVTPQDALDLIPSLPQIYDEPFADSSQLPTYLVSRMTREHVTVALSGDGGDELFCGYPRYHQNLKAWMNRDSVSSRLKRLASGVPADLVIPLVRALVPSQRKRSSHVLRHRLRRQRDIARAGDLSEFYRQGISYWTFPGSVLRNASEPGYALTRELPPEVPGNDIKTLMWRDLNWYLPDDILTKVDRAAMACSLETRIPMLDHRVVSFALGLPTRLNVANSCGKQVLRSVLYRHVPRELVDRPKKGFAVPVASWLRGSLRDWAESLLETGRLEQQGYWHADTLRWYWEEHLTGREDYSFELWGVLMLQAWLDSANR